jgi:hypothetical protein
MQDLIDLEEQGWQALSSGEDASKKFYNFILHNDVVMLFPGGMLLDGKENILQALATQPWKSFQIEKPRVILLSEGAGVLVYRVTAQREGVIHMLL